MVEPELIAAIVRLGRDPDFRAFMAHVGSRKEAARDGFEVAADPWSAGRFQGESSLATELMKLVDGAPDALRAIQRGRDQGHRF